MRHKCRMLMTTLGFICLGAASASADICFNYGSGGGILVSKEVTFPARNTCRPFGFFESGGLNGAATGSICTDGNTAIFHYHYDGCSGHYVESATCYLKLTSGALPTTNSSCRVTVLSSNQPAVYEDFTAKMELCDPSPPLPTGTCIPPITRERERRMEQRR